jgi:hypothetical protein
MGGFMRRLCQSQTTDMTWLGSGSIRTLGCRIGLITIFLREHSDANACDDFDRTTLSGSNLSGSMVQAAVAFSLDCVPLDPASVV